jgi:hypothetical protein
MSNQLPHIAGQLRKRSILKHYLARSEAFLLRM